MPRIRTIKPEFWTSEQVVECSLPARLLFVGLWNFADDGGVHPASIRRLTMEVFPGDAFSADDVAGWVAELVDVGLLVEFAAEGREFWSITGWRHQKIDRPSIRHPQFDEHSTSARRTLDVDTTNTRRTLDVDTTNTRRTLDEPHPPEKEKEKEKEKETERRKNAAAFSRDRKNGESTSKKRGRKPAVGVEDVTFPPGFDSDDVRGDVERWLQHRRRIRKAYKSAEAVGALLKQWEARGPTAFRAAVEHSIANEYQGLFEGGTNGRATTNRVGAGQRHGDTPTEVGQL